MRSFVEQGARRRVRPLAGVLLIATLAGGCASLSHQGVTFLRQGRLLLGSRDAPPPENESGWLSVELPDVWTIARRRLGTAGWYRFALSLEQTPRDLWGIYLPRVGMNAAVYVNGQLVGDGGPFRPEIARNWNRPLYFTVPAGLLRAGPNVVDVRLETPPSSPGMLQAVALGPDEVLRRAWEWRSLEQVTVAEVVCGATLVMALLVGVLFLPRDKTGEYRWFVAGMLLWTLTALDTLLRHPPLPTPVWEWTTQTALNWVIPCCTLAAHRALRIRRPRLEAAIVAVAIGGAVVRALVPPLYAFRVMLVWLLWTIGLGVYLVWLFGRAARRTETRRGRAFQIAGLIGLALGIHDIAFLAAGMPAGGPLLSPYVPAVAMLAAGWVMVANLGTALVQSEELNAELEQRVADKHSELERNYGRLRELERERAIAGERERIMRDMHDGMGGQLVSTLAMVESGRFTSDTVADAIHAALDDMRLVVDSLEPVEGDLLSILATVRERLEPRLARHGIRFDWQVSDLPPLPGFGPERALQVLRVVQEAVTNVLKHAQATTITMRTGVGPGPSDVRGVFVEVHDDGRGFDGPRAGGRGLSNMARRAAELGGSVSVSAARPGTTVRLWLPSGDATRPA